MEGNNRNKINITPETEFWGHCSNLQAWVENDYNPNLLHSSLSIPLLYKLCLKDRKIFDKLLYHLDDNWKQYGKDEKRKILLIGNYRTIIQEGIKKYHINERELEDFSLFFQAIQYLEYGYKIKMDFLEKRKSRKQLKKKREKARYRYWEIKCFGKDLEFRKKLREIRNNKYDTKNSNPADYLPYLYSKGRFINAGVFDYLEIDDIIYIRDKDGNYSEFDRDKREFNISINNYYGKCYDSGWKAMEIKIGKFKLNFSYHTLIGFGIDNRNFITEKKYGQTTASHKYSVGGWYNNRKRYFIPHRLFQFIVSENLKGILK